MQGADVAEVRQSTKVAEARQSAEIAERRQRAEGLRAEPNGRVPYLEPFERDRSFIHAPTVLSKTPGH